MTETIEARTYPCEEWEADVLDPDQVETLHGADAMRAYLNWIYHNLK